MADVHFCPYDVDLRITFQQLIYSKISAKRAHPWSDVARFPEFTQNSSERQILWSLCSVDFHTLTLQLPIQTLHSVAPELPSFCEFTQNFSKTSTPQKTDEFNCHFEKFRNTFALV